MGKPMYNIGKNVKEKARQQKQLEKAAKRLTARQNKAAMSEVAPREDPAAETAPDTEAPVV